MRKIITGVSATLAMVLAMFLGVLGTTGILLGLLMFLGVWLVYSKFPERLQGFCQNHPLIADVSLTGLVTWGASTLFGSGLVLAFAAVTCGVLVSGALYLENTYNEAQIKDVRAVTVR